jgi:hypothetical protein
VDLNPPCDIQACTNVDNAHPIADIALPIVIASDRDHSAVGPESYRVIAARCDLDDADPATNIDSSRCPILSSLTMSSLIAAMSIKITLPLALLKDCLNETSPIIHGLVTLNLSGSRSNLIRVLSDKCNRRPDISEELQAPGGTSHTCPPSG